MKTYYIYATYDMLKKRECRKCGNIIPNWTKIDGIQKNLHNRKFCLECSPYKGHNTKHDDPSRPSRKKHYSEWTIEEKKKNLSGILWRGLDRKRKLIELSGNKCLRCEYEYNGCERALSFHHKNRADKKFGLTVNNLWSKSWDDIILEFNKCDMLCLVCHAELEHQIYIDNKESFRHWKQS